MSIFKNLKTLHNKFGFHCHKKPHILEHKHMQARIEFIQEELDELRTAAANRDLPEVIDALIDISYVAVGTLDLMGVKGQLHWDEVHHCNMNKQIGSQSKRPGMVNDLIKPDGWRGPNHTKLIDEAYKDGQ